jgi:hypothetical protein
MCDLLARTLERQQIVLSRLEDENVTQSENTHSFEHLSAVWALKEQV